MSPLDFRLICTALGFTAVVLRGEKLPKKETALRATGFANLIEEFCRDAVPEAFDDVSSEKTLVVAERMAVAIVAIYREKGGCLPQDLAARGFTPDEISRYWVMAKALASVEQQMLNS